MLDFLKSILSVAKREHVEPWEFEQIPSNEYSAPFELVACPGAAAIDGWRALRSRAEIVPVLLGPREKVKYALEVMELNETSPDEILRIGLAEDIDGWLAARKEEEPDRFSESDETISGRVDPISALSPARHVLTGKLYDQVAFALVPASDAWTPAAILKPGGWNECPESAIHVAFFKRWFERYGAVVTTITSDVIEFHVERPPTTDAAALQLAWEQYVYCTDIVDQGVGSVGRLAAALKNSPNWYFWWD